VYVVGFDGAWTSRVRSAALIFVSFRSGLFECVWIIGNALSAFPELDALRGWNPTQSLENFDSILTDIWNSRLLSTGSLFAPGARPHGTDSQ
jgi:hypothetical protein